MKKKRTISLVILIATLYTTFSSVATESVKAYQIRDGRRWTASYYEGSQGACGPLVGNYVASKFYKCGQRLTLKHGGKKVKVVVLDRCQCGIDMRKSAFQVLAPTSQGLVKVRAYYGWKR